MATIRTKLKQLRDADVRFISLVDRAATRIPFRVLKREKENTMGIDLTKVFKSDGTAGKKPHVAALVVFAQKDEAAGTKVLEAIKTHGFKTDVVQKADNGETVVYVQSDQKGETHVVRLSDQTLVNVAGLKAPEGWMGELIEEHGFFPDLKMATAALYDEMALVAKSETPQADAKAALESYASYLEQMLVLPVNCYKLDEAVLDIVAKCSCEGKDKKDEVVKEEEAESKAETEAEKKKRIADHPPAEMAVADEDDDQKPPPDAVKSDAILAALKEIKESTTTQLTSLSTKLESVVTEQASQKKVLDDVVQKADTLSTTLKTTVTAPPVREDRPGPVRMRVQKDDDPRTGNFDTAFLRRSR
jgi:hypothetical protein